MPFRRFCSWVTGRPSSSGRDARFKDFSADSCQGAPLRNIVQGCQVLRKLGLPPDAAHVLADIEANLEHLMNPGHQGQLGASIWPCPPSASETAEWLRHRPAGGRLLHSQVCIAAASPATEEWFMGRIFVSERGIVVQGSSGMFSGSRVAELDTGLVPWENIDAMDDEQSVVCIELKRWEGMKLVCMQLRLQLGDTSEGDRLRKAWHHYYIDDSDEFHSFVTEVDEDGTHTHRIHASCFEHSGSFHQVATAPITQSFLTASNALPAHGTFKGREPLITGHINVSMEAVRRRLEQDEDWFMCRFQEEQLKTFDMNITPWTAGQVIPGTLVRNLKFKLPRPDDVPKALANLIGFPPVLNSIMVARLHCTEDQCTLVMHSFSPNVPYGENQRVEDIIVFTPEPAGGVKVSKWMASVVVKALPFAARMAAPLVEKKMKADGVDTFATFLNILQEEFSR